jgi:hypothetical protein
MGKLALKERRYVEFTRQLLQEAVLAFDREHNGRLWRAVNPIVSVVPGGDGRIEIESAAAEGSARERVDRSAAWVAAALLHFCFAYRIPIPRQATKRIEPIERGLQLVIELTISVIGTIDLSSGRSAAPVPSTRREGVGTRSNAVPGDDDAGSPMRDAAKA